MDPQNERRVMIAGVVVTGNGDVGYRRQKATKTVVDVFSWYTLTVL